MPQRFIRKTPNRKIVRPANRYNLSVNKPAENKNDKVEPNMNNIEQLKAIVGEETKIPKRKVKVEKKDKGLIERTEDSTILITEDNKLMLND